MNPGTLSPPRRRRKVRVEKSQPVFQYPAQLLATNPTGKKEYIDAKKKQGMKTKDAQQEWKQRPKPYKKQNRFQLLLDIRRKYYPNETYAESRKAVAKAPLSFSETSQKQLKNIHARYRRMPLNLSYGTGNNKTPLIKEAYKPLVRGKRDKEKNQIQKFTLTNRGKFESLFSSPYGQQWRELTPEKQENMAKYVLGTVTKYLASTHQKNPGEKSRRRKAHEVREQRLPLIERRLRQLQTEIRNERNTLVRARRARMELPHMNERMERLRGMQNRLTVMQGIAERLGDGEYETLLREEIDKKKPRKRKERFPGKKEREERHAERVERKKVQTPEVISLFEKENGRAPVVEKEIEVKEPTSKEETRREPERETEREPEKKSAEEQWKEYQENVSKSQGHSMLSAKLKRGERDMLIKRILRRRRAAKYLKERPALSQAVKKVPKKKRTVWGFFFGED